MSESSHTAKRYPWLAVAIVLLAFVLRQFRLTYQSIWYDEAFTVYLARLPLLEQIETLRQFNPIPFFYLLTKGWMALAGDSAFAIRWLPLMGAVLAVALCYRLGAEMGGRRVGVIAAAGLALSPMHIYYAQEVRAYSWLTVMVLASAILLYRVPRGLTRIEAACLGLIQALTLFTQIWGAFTLLALNGILLLAWLVRRLRWPEATRWIAANVVTLLVAGPWFWAARATPLSNVIFFRGTVPMEQIVEDIARSLSVGIASATLPAGVALFWLLVAVAIGASARHSVRYRWLFALGASATPILGIVLASLDRPRYNARYIIGALPFLFLLIALGWQAIRYRSRWLGAGFSAGIATFLAISLWATVNQSFDPSYFRPDFRAVSRYIEERGDPAQDGIVMVGGHFHPVIRYYLGERFELYPLPAELLHNVDNPLGYDDLQPLNEAAARHRRLWLILWQRELADPAGIVLRQLEHLALRHEVFATFGEIDLMLFEIAPGTTFETDPTPSQSLPSTIWGRTLQLHGFDIVPEQLARSGQPLEVALYWEPLDVLRTDYFASIQLIGADGRLYGQADHILYNDFYPSSQWKAGELLVDRYQLQVPPETPPGIYQLIIVLYDRSGTRWLTPDGDEFLELVPSIEVTAP